MMVFVDEKLAALKLCRTRNFCSDSASSAQLLFGWLGVMLQSICRFFIEQAGRLLHRLCSCQFLIPQLQARVVK